MYYAGATKRDGSISSGGKYPPEWLLQQSVAMGSASAVLGPLLDGMHSRYGVLKYKHPIQIFLIPDTYLLETSIWTPPLFALAGIILGVCYPLLDDYFQEDVPAGGTNPPWSFVLFGIACFVGQYWISAVLESPLNGLHIFNFPYLDILLLWLAVLHWRYFDGTRHGAAMAILTAFAGPGLELFLIHIGMHAYTNPNFLSIPSWIPWVYACGGPAVGNLGRKVRNTLTN